MSNFEDMQAGRPFLKLNEISIVGGSRDKLFFVSMKRYCSLNLNRS
jgi:hypothetical protein